MKGFRLQSKMHPFTTRSTNDSKEFPTMEISKYKNLLLKWWRAINNFSTQIHSKSWMKMQINVSSIQYFCKFLYECAAKYLCKRPLRQLNFPSKSCFAPITTRLQMSISSKNHPYATNHTMSNLQFSLCVLSIYWYVISFISAVYILVFNVLPLSLCYFFLN